MAEQQRELEDDVARLVCCLASQVVQYDVYCGDAPTDEALQQFRDALGKLIREQIREALTGDGTNRPNGITAAAR